MYGRALTRQGGWATGRGGKGMVGRERVLRVALLCVRVCVRMCAHVHTHIRCVVRVLLCVCVHVCAHALTDREGAADLGSVGSVGGRARRGPVWGVRGEAGSKTGTGLGRPLRCIGKDTDLGVGRFLKSNTPDRTPP